MRTPHRARALCPMHRTALAAALALAFGTTGAGAVVLSVPGAYRTIGVAVAAAAPGDTIQVDAGFVNSEPNPIVVNVAGLTITAQGSGAVLDATALYAYGGAGFASIAPLCGIDSSSAPISVDNFEITGFSYGPGLCGQFNKVTRNVIHGNNRGIVVVGGTPATIGGDAPLGNVLYGNNTQGFGIGVLVQSDATATIAGNSFGVNGPFAQPNGTGVSIGYAALASVVGNTFAESSEAISLTGSGTIAHNFIGVNASGIAIPGAGGNGINLGNGDSNVDVHDNQIFGMTTGIQATFMSGGQIHDNTIGKGTANGPSLWGIGVLCSSGLQINGNTVSGESVGGIYLATTSATTLFGNTLSGNSGDGIQMSSQNCAARGGASDKRATPLSVIARVLFASSGNIIDSNIITKNTGAGISIPSGSNSGGNLFRGNTITGNSGSGISIQDSASTGNAIIAGSNHRNTPKNIDLVSGANDSISSPLISSVIQSGGSTTVNYQVLGPATGSASYTIEFFTNANASAPAGTTSQRQVFLPNVSGTQSFSEVFSGQLLDNFSLTSTLSSAPGGWVETSEFSPIGTAVLVTPPIDFTPFSSDFGGIYVHENSDPRTITVTNTTANPMAIGAPSLTGPFIITSQDCPATLPPHASCSVNVVFAPAVSGRATGVLSFGTFSTNLSGSGLDAPILQMPGLLDFGTFIVGSPTVTRTASISNSGSAVVTIDSIVLSGPFTFTHDCPINLLPGASCTFTVSFSSSEVGTAAGIITIHSNALGGDHSIALGATVQLRPEPVVEVNPASLGFGQQLIGSQGPPMRVLILNSGGAAATFGPFTTSADYVVVGTNCGAALAPQATCSVDLALNPKGFGGRHGELTFTSNAAHSPFSVSLDGSGCRPPVLLGNRTGKQTDICSQ